MKANASEKVDIHPADHPLGDGHHTEQPFTQNDRETGELLGYFMGTIFSDVNYSTYFREEMTSVDLWARVSRALRIHGLRIVDNHAVLPHKAGMDAREFEACLERAKALIVEIEDKIVSSGHAARSAATESR